jgi:hypothetical protein
VRNEKGRLRIGNIAIAVHSRFAEADLEKAARCLGLFEEYCVVTQSVRQGIPTSVSVKM